MVENDIASERVDTVVWDLGNVLIRWDRELLYRRLIPDDRERERFFAETMTMAFNQRIDLGLGLAPAVAELSAAHPEWAAEIAAFDEQWHQMYPGPVEGTREVVETLSHAGIRQLVLSNFGRENFDRVRATGLYDVLDHMDAIVLSGDIGLVKPSQDIFDHLTSTHSVTPERSVFIDDSRANIDTGAALGFHTIHFIDAAAARARLADLDLLE